MTPLESLIASVEEKVKNNFPPKVKAPEQEARATFAKPNEAMMSFDFIYKVCVLSIGRLIFVLYILQ